MFTSLFYILECFISLPYNHNNEPIQDILVEPELRYFYSDCSPSEVLNKHKTEVSLSTVGNSCRPIYHPLIPLNL